MSESLIQKISSQGTKTAIECNLEISQSDSKNEEVLNVKNNQEVETM